MTEFNKDSIKDLMGMGKNLMDLAGMGKGLTEEDVKKKNVADLGFTTNTFEDMMNMGNKLKALSQLTSILGTLGIDKSMIDKGLKLASTLAGAGEKGSESLKEEKAKSLSDIGLNLDTFADINKMGKTLNDLSGSVPNIDTKDMGNIVEGLGGLLGKFKK